MIKRTDAGIFRKKWCRIWNWTEPDFIHTQNNKTRKLGT